MKLYQITFSVTSGEYEHFQESLIAAPNPGVANLCAQAELAEFWGEGEETKLTDGLAWSPFGERYASIYGVKELDKVLAYDSKGQLYEFGFVQPPNAKESK